MGSFSLLHWMVVLIILTVIFIPFIRILQRAGRSGWWILLWFVPIANVIGLWVFAFSRWPALDKARYTT